MNLFYGLGRGVGWAIPRTATLIDASVWLSIANVCALVWFALLIRDATARATSGDTDSAPRAS
jgi:hypothetical protein